VIRRVITWASICCGACMVAGLVLGIAFVYNLRQEERLVRRLDDAFLDDLANGRADSAYARLSREARGSMSAAELSQLVARNPTLKFLRDLAPQSPDVQGHELNQEAMGVWRVSNYVIEGDDSLSCTYRIVKEGGSFAVDRLEVSNKISDRVRRELEREGHWIPPSAKTGR
jgi:hypothetical protein